MTTSTRSYGLNRAEPASRPSEPPRDSLVYPGAPPPAPPPGAPQPTQSRGEQYRHVQKVAGRSTIQVSTRVDVTHPDLSATRGNPETTFRRASQGRRR